MVPWKPTSELQNTWSVRLDAFIVFFDSGHSFFDTTFLSFFLWRFFRQSIFHANLFHTFASGEKNTQKLHAIFKGRDFFLHLCATQQITGTTSFIDDRAAFLHLWHPRVSWPKHRSFQPPETIIGSQAVWCLLGGVKHHFPREGFSDSMVVFGRVSSVRLKWSLHFVSLQSIQKLKGQRKWCKPFFSWQWWPSLTQSGSPWIFWKLQKRSFPKLRNRLPSDYKKTLKIGLNALKRSYFQPSIFRC